MCLKFINLDPSLYFSITLRISTTYICNMNISISSGNVILETIAHKNPAGLRSTSNSVRATGVTQCFNFLFESSVSEKVLIAER